MNTIESWRKKASSCTTCDMSSYCKHKVLPPRRRATTVDLLVVGEAPGISEYTNKEPFIGPAGQILRDILKEVLEEHPGTSIELTNSILCTPFVSEARASIVAPSLSEVRACNEHLKEFINIRQPKVIIAAGKIAVKALTEFPHSYITHPSAIMQAKKFQYEFDKAVLTITRALEAVE